MFTVAKNYSFVYRRAELAAGVQAAAVQRVRPVGQAVVKGREARGPRVAPTPIGCDASASARRANSATSNSPTVPKCREYRRPRSPYACVCACLCSNVGNVARSFRFSIVHVHLLYRELCYVTH